MIERALIAAVLALAALLGLQTLRLSNEREAHANTRTQAAEDRAAYDRERTRVAIAFGKSVTQALATQQELTTKAAKTQEKYHETVSHLAAARDDLLERLRNAEAQARPDACSHRTWGSTLYAPPKLPPLPAFDRKLLEGSFLEELGSGMFEPITGPTSYELLPSPATGSTKTPRLRSNQ